jgi:hypothetical protein
MPSDLTQLFSVLGERTSIMGRERDQLRSELARLVNDDADAAEKRTLTDAEHRERDIRQKRIGELCDELHRLATQEHTG